MHRLIVFFVFPLQTAVGKTNNIASKKQQYQITLAPIPSKNLYLKNNQP